MKKEKNTNGNTGFSVILEKIYSEFKVFGEGQKALTEKVDTVFEELGEQKEEITGIKMDMRIIKTDIATLKTDVSILKKDVSEIKEGSGKRLTHLESVR